jgi:hypothetical protein
MEVRSSWGERFVALALNQPVFVIGITSIVYHVAPLPAVALCSLLPLAGDFDVIPGYVSVHWVQ